MNFVSLQGTLVLAGLCPLLTPALTSPWITQRLVLHPQEKGEEQERG